MLQKKSPFLRVLRSFHAAANIEIRGGGGRPCARRFAQGTFFLHDPDPHQSEKSSTRTHRKYLNRAPYNGCRRGTLVHNGTVYDSLPRSTE